MVSASDMFNVLVIFRLLLLDNTIPSFNQNIAGVGSPVALQVRVISPNSLTDPADPPLRILSSLDPLFKVIPVIFALSVGNKKDGSRAR